KQVLDELPDADRCLLLETLPTDLPFDLTVPILPDGIYWKRSSQDRWNSMNYVCDYDNSWKRLYLERHLQEYIENLELEEYNLQNIEHLVNLCSPYVKRLNIRQLQAAKVPESLEWQSEEDVILDEPSSIHHINLEPFIKGLCNLEELHIMFGVRNCGMDFAWNLFKFSIVDCRNIGLGLDSAKSIKLFRIHRSMLYDTHVAVLMQHVVKNSNITKLDFSHCRIGDTGALAIGKVLTIHPMLEELVLCNNLICGKGAAGIAYALTQLSCKLKILNLRLNAIGDDGVLDLCSSLAYNKCLQELILGACSFTEKAAIKLGQMLQQNCTLLFLDVKNNYLGEVGGEAFNLGLKTNSTLLRLDIRRTGITEEYESSINLILKQNNIKYKIWQRELADAEQNKDEEWEEHVAERKEKLSRHIDTKHTKY
ncbi:hypothetical protein L9F63_005519, partial [Diploptera punctata]